MHDPSTESCKPRHTKRYPLKYFDPVVATLDISISIGIFKRIEDLFASVLVGEGHFDHLFKTASLDIHDPLAQPFRRIFPVCARLHIFELLLQCIRFFKGGGYAKQVPELNPLE